MRSDLLLPGPLSRPLTPQAPSFLAYLLVLHQHSPPRFLSVPVRARPRVRKDLLSSNRGLGGHDLALTNEALMSSQFRGRVTGRFRGLW